MILAWDNFNTFSKQKSKQKSKQIQIFIKKHLKFFTNILYKIFWWLLIKNGIFQSFSKCLRNILIYFCQIFSEGHSKFSLFNFQTFNPKKDLSGLDYATFLAKWASRVKHTSYYNSRDWKVFMVLPEKQEVWLVFERGHFDKNHLECVKAGDCTISMRKPFPDPLITQEIHPEEETFIQELPVDQNWDKF